MGRLLGVTRRGTFKEFLSNNEMLRPRLALSWPLKTVALARTGCRGRRYVI